MWGSKTWHTLLTSGDGQSGMIAAVSLRLLYLIFLQVLRLVFAAGTNDVHQGRRAVGAAPRGRRPLCQDHVRQLEVSGSQQRA